MLIQPRVNNIERSRLDEVVLCFVPPRAGAAYALRLNITG